MGKPNTTFEVMMAWNRRHIPCGTIHHSSMNAPVVYRDIAGLFFLISEICDAQNILPKDAEWRTLLKNSEKRRMKQRVSTEMKKQQQIQFTITIVSRKNYTMRGYFCVLGKQLVFRSGMEAQRYVWEIMRCAEHKELMTDEKKVPSTQQIGLR